MSVSITIFDSWFFSRFSYNKYSHVNLRPVGTDMRSYRTQMMPNWQLPSSARAHVDLINVVKGF